MTVNTKPKIIAFGCSVTHGSELVTDTYSLENIPGSYPAQVAGMLGLDYVNYAVPGVSNEYIFHNILDHLDDLQGNILLVGWTSLVRETWIDSGVHWCFIPNWGAKLNNISSHDLYVDGNIVTDDEAYLKDVSAYYQFFLKYKTDIDQYSRKLHHYIECLRRLNLPTVELSWGVNNIPGTISINDIWMPGRGRHPTYKEHTQIALKIKPFFSKFEI